MSLHYRTMCITRYTVDQASRAPCGLTFIGIATVQGAHVHVPYKLKVLLDSALQKSLWLR